MERKLTFTFTLVLTKEQALDINEAIQSIYDCGPIGEGWKSDTIEEFCKTFEDQLYKQLNN